MNRFQNFFYGRYGNDMLNTVLLLFAVLLSVVLRFTPWWWLSYVSCVPIALVIFRTFSRNVSQRRKENEIFMSGFYKMKNWITGRKAQAADKTHKYYTCKSCGARLRVPKGKGKIRITCPQCKREMIKKT